VAAVALALLLTVVTPPAPPTAGAPSPARAAPSPVTVTAKASKAEVTLGEEFAVEVKASGPAGASYVFPGEAADDTLELRTPADDKNGASPADAGTHRYAAVVYALGEAQIPPIAVHYQLADGRSGEAASEPIALKVGSLLPKDPQQQKLADIRGPLSLSIGAPFWIALAAAALLVAGAAFALWRRRRVRPETAAAPVPMTEPDVEAGAALDALAGEGLLARGEFRAFYIRLTAVAKRYLERRLAAPVLEMTTAETVAFLRGHPHGGELLTTMRDLADAADRIKFARGDGLRAEAERHLASVRALVAALEQRLRPTPAESEGRAA